MPPSSLRGSTRLRRPYEGAHEFSVDLRGDRVNVDALFCQKRACVSDIIHARLLNPDVIEARGSQPGAIVAFIKRTANAADPEQRVLAHVLGDLPACHDV